MADSTQIVQAASTADLSALTANLAILVAFITAAIVGVSKGLKQFKNGDKRSLDAGSDTKIVAATLLENMTLNDWSQTNREVRDAVFSLRNAVIENTKEMEDLRHCIQLDMATRGHRR